MLELKDIVPQTKTIEIRGKKTKIHPISPAVVGVLAFRFPQLAAAFGEGEGEGKAAANAALIFAMGDEALGVILAAALGHAGNPDWETATRALTLEEQIEIIEATVALTTPSGLVPFVEKLSLAISSLGGTKPPASAGDR